MFFLVAFSLCHTGGQYVSSIILETSLLRLSDVRRRHIDNWETIRIPKVYQDQYQQMSIRVLSFQEIGHD